MTDARTMVATYAARVRRDAAAVAARTGALRARVATVAAALAAEFGVSEVILFGSLVEGGAHPGSDVDLAVRGLPPARYFEALARAADLLGADVDLIPLESVRASLRERIAQTGVVVLTRG